MELLFENMLPGVGVFGTSDATLVKSLVLYLRNKGFRIEALWGRTLKSAEDLASSFNISFYTNKVMKLWEKLYLVSAI